jgi:hypothetical protein
MNGERRKGNKGNDRQARFVIGIKKRGTSWAVGSL